MQQQQKSKIKYLEILEITENKLPKMTSTQLLNTNCVAIPQAKCKALRNKILKNNMSATK